MAELQPGMVLTYSNPLALVKLTITCFNGRFTFP